MNHVLEKHDNCEVAHCPICDGGLAVCTVCKSFEGGLATECPGVEQTEDQTRAVYSGEWDYIGGLWVRK